MVVEAELQPVTSCPPTAETRKLQEQAKEGRDPEPRSDGMALELLVVCACSRLIRFFQVAVEKYEEVLHHLQFAQELHKTLDGLTMNVSL